VVLRFGIRGGTGVPELSRVPLPSSDVLTAGGQIGPRSARPMGARRRSAHTVRGGCPPRQPPAWASAAARRGGRSAQAMARDRRWPRVRPARVGRAQGPREATGRRGLDRPGGRRVGGVTPRHEKLAHSGHGCDLCTRWVAGLCSAAPGRL